MFCVSNTHTPGGMACQYPLDIFGGRSYIPPMSNREEIIRLMLTSSEKADIVKAATEAALPVAVWVRMQAIKAARE